MILRNYLPGEVVIDIHALADYLLDFFSYA